MGANLSAHRLKEQLVESINAAGLPAVLVRYILTELLDSVERLEREALAQEQAGEEVTEDG